MPDMPYSIRDGKRLHCFTCGADSDDEKDVYFRYCLRCGLLGPEIRQRWNAERDQLHDMCRDFGWYKRVVRTADGVAFKVPVEWIVTEGIRGDDLEKFPRWPGAVVPDPDTRCWPQPGDS